MIFETYKTVTVQILNKKIYDQNQILDIIKYLQDKNLDAYIEIKPKNSGMILTYPIVRFSNLVNNTVKITIINKRSCGIKNIDISEISLLKVNNVDEEVLGLRPDVSRWTLLQPFIEESKVSSEV